MKAMMVVLIMMVTLPAVSFSGEKSTTPAAIRPIVPVARGAVSAATLPFEPIASVARERKMHRYLWPITYPPRLVTNLITRTTSAIYDLVMMPFVAPFTDDIDPLTEPMGLPDYSWQKSSDF